MTLNEKINQYLADNQPAMIELLDRLVSIQSGSRNKQGVDAVGRVIEAEMASMGFACERIPSETLGDQLVARSTATGTDKKQILITGHMDTVFPEDTDFRTFTQDENRCYGPGVADMKGGLVVGIFALRTLLNAGGLPENPITFIFNSDEEIGSPASRELIEKEARKSGMAFVLEAGGLENEIVTGRKGNLSAVLIIEGKAGHAAFATADKASAILELAHKIIAIEGLNDPSKGQSANVGTVRGGIGPNTVPAEAVAKLDFRFLMPDDYAVLKPEIEKICRQPVIPGTRTDLRIVSQRSPMPGTPGNLAMYGQIERLARTLGMPVKSELRQGVSDANLISAQGVPVIDGLGPSGAKDHSKDEYIETQSLFDRTLLFSHILSQVTPP